MPDAISRRKFVKTAAAGLGALRVLSWDQLLCPTFFAEGNELIVLSHELLKEWLDALLKLQVNDSTAAPELFGGIICPYKKTVHGRIGDTVYPLLYMAKTTHDKKYLASARKLYQWMETNVSREDGSWLNEPVAGSWQGTTVFTLIALAEAISYHGDIVDEKWKSQIKERLIRAGDFICEHFTVSYGNINYPINAAYGLLLTGELLDIDRFRIRGKLLADEVWKAVTSEGFIAGEGAPHYETSAKGCYAVDLGYNVEESLPALAAYAQLAKDKVRLSKVLKAMQTHLEFMLPDGAWDNSWGTRNYKWSYWGSRTTDGAAAAYALLSDHDPRFYVAALQNTLLLKKCTHDGLLYGGPHLQAEGILPCVHHTFCHAKSLTKILDHAKQITFVDVKNIRLPREEHHKIKFFKEIQTWLIAEGGFKATFTTYDQPYKNTLNGHASGGVLTLLWHRLTGPLFCASMNQYQLFEADNMQTTSLPEMCLTPRVELHVDGSTFSNICDLKAEVFLKEDQERLEVRSISTLVDGRQQKPFGQTVTCFMNCIFDQEAVHFTFKVSPCDFEHQLKIIVPIIAAPAERYQKNASELIIYKETNVTVRLLADADFTMGQSVFNFVPGLQALPMCFGQPEVNFSLRIN